MHPMGRGGEANRMRRGPDYQRLALYCMVFAALLSAAQTVEGMVERKRRRKLQEERKKIRRGRSR